MGLFDSVINVAGEMISGHANENDLLGAAAQLIRNNPDGLAGVVEQFRNGGLAEAVNSWVGTGDNQAVTAESIQQAIGQTQLDEIATKFGVSSEQISSGLANVLPELINQLTPNGQVEGDSNALLETGLSILKGKLLGG